MEAAPEGETRILRLAAPLVVSFVLRSLFTLVDTFYAATLSDAAVAAIGLTIPLEMAFIAAWVGCSNALTSLLGRAIGAGDAAGIDRIVRAGYRLVWLLGPSFLLLGLGCVWAAPRLGLEAELARSFAIYAGVLIGGTGLTGFWSIVPDSIVKAHHDTRATMIAGLCSNVTNVALNTFFVFVLHWGVAGIALSTVLGRLAGLSYALWRAGVLERARVTGAAQAGGAVCVVADCGVGRLLRLAVPSALTTLLSSAETAVANALLARGAHATAAIAAFGIYHRFLYLGLMPLLATAVAMLPFVARHAGAGRFDVVRRGLRDVALAAAGYAVGVLLPAFAFGAPSIATWLAQGETARALAAGALRLVPAVTVASAAVFVARPVFEGLGRFTPPLVIAALRHVVLALPAAVVGMELAVRRGQPPLYGLVAGFGCASLLASVLAAVWARRVLGVEEGAAARRARLGVGPVAAVAGPEGSHV